MRGKNIGRQKKYKEIDEPKRMITEYLTRLLGVKKLSSSTNKKIEEQRNIWGRLEPVYTTLVRQAESIQWALANKSFASEEGKINYVFAIIKNHIGEVLEEEMIRAKEREKTEACDVITPDVFDDLEDWKFQWKVRDLSEYVKNWD